MAGITISINLDALQDMDNMFDVLETVGRDFSPAWENVAENMGEAFGETFDLQGPNWTPLSPFTIADRIEKGYGPGPILFRDGTLRYSVEKRNDRNHFEVIGNDTMTYGSTVPYAMVHQDGTDRVPQRRLTNEALLLPAIASGVKVTLEDIFARAARTD